MGNQDTKTMKLSEFPAVRIRTVDESLMVPCELVAPSIAITACLDFSDGEYTLGGGFRLVHVETGHAFIAGQACIECARSVGKQLAALDIDWSKVDPADKATSSAAIGDELPAVMKALRRFPDCQQQVCQLGDGGEMEECEACGFTGSHAPYCIQMVVPMLFAHQERMASRPSSQAGGA